MLLLELLPRLNCIRSTSFPRSSTNVLQKQWRARLRKLHIKRAWPVASVWRKTANRHFSLVACHEIKLKARDAAGILARRYPAHSTQSRVFFAGVKCFARKPHTVGKGRVCFC